MGLPSCIVAELLGSLAAHDSVVAGCCLQVEDMQRIFQYITSEEPPKVANSRLETYLADAFHLKKASAV